MTQHKPIVTIALLVGLAVAAPARSSSTTSFDPEFLLAYGYTNNVALGGSGDEPQPTNADDNFLRLDVRLPLVHRWKTGKLDLNYSPRVLRYDTFGELDRTDHFLNFRFTDNPGRKSSLELRIDASATQNQGDAERENPGNAFLSRRTDRQYYRGDVVYRQGFANTWRWSAIATSRFHRFDEIDDVPDDGSVVSQVEDRDSWMVAFQIDKDISRRTFLGGRYERSNFTLEISGEADTDALLFTYERRLDQRSNLEFTVGGFTTKGTAVVNCENATDPSSCMDGSEASDRTNGIQGDAIYTRRYENFTLRARATHRPSAGGALLGAITFSTVQLSLGQSKPDAVWRWSVSPRWALRDPLDDLQANRQSWSIAALVARRIVGNLSVRFRTNYIDQISNGEQVSDRDVWSSDIGLVWAPWRGTRMAQR